MIPRRKHVTDADRVLVDFSVHGGDVVEIARGSMREHTSDLYELEDITTVEDAGKGIERYLAGRRKVPYEGVP